MAFYETAVRPLLFRLDAERAHDLTVRASELSGRSSLARRAARRALAVDDPRLRTTFAGLELANPLGLAAGFDKNGRAVGLLGALGFGHVEIGSVSAWPSDGNPRPRLFRIPQDGGIVVSYGVPNDGADAIRARLERGRPAVALGINLVKTNDPARPAVAPDVYEDYARSFAAAAGPRALRDAQPLVPELGRRPRLLRRAAADRRAAGPARGLRPARAGDPQAQADDSTRASCARSSRSPTATRSWPASRSTCPPASRASSS